MKRRPLFAGQAGVVAAILALGMSAAPVAPVQSARDVAPVSKEYVDPKRAQKEKKKKQPIGGKGKGQRWVFDKRGNAVDGVGNFRSAKRLRREILTGLIGVPNTGRQWRILKKKLRVIAPDLIHFPTSLAALRLARRNRAAA